MSCPIVSPSERRLGCKLSRNVCYIMLVLMAQPKSSAGFASGVRTSQIDDLQGLRWGVAFGGAGDGGQKPHGHSGRLWTRY